MWYVIDVCVCACVCVCVCVAVYIYIYIIYCLKNYYLATVKIETATDTLAVQRHSLQMCKYKLLVKLTS